MYLVGAAHPSKIAAQRQLERVISGGERLVTDAEVLQEILHRYVRRGLYPTDWAARFRRLARDYERLAQTLAGFHYLAFACLMRIISLIASP